MCASVRYSFGPAKKTICRSTVRIRRQRLRRINQRRLDALRRRRARHLLDVWKRRQRDRPRDDLLRRLFVGIASSAKNWLCAAAQTTLFAPARNSVLGVRGKKTQASCPVEITRAAGRRALLAVEPHRAAVHGNCCRPPPSASPCRRPIPAPADASGLSEVFSSRTLALHEIIRAEVKFFTSRRPSGKVFPRARRRRFSSA